MGQFGQNSHQPFGKMIKRIGILTFHASHNYGSMLQAYALQTFLEQQGYEVTIINHRNLAQRSLYIKPAQLLKRKTLKDFITHPRLFIQNVGKWNKFERFMTDYYRLSWEMPLLVNVERAVNDELKLDAVITGGDQIWNMDCWDFSLSYYLPFETPGVRRVAYSPSMGDEVWFRPDHYVGLLKTLVDRYDFPSVREENASRFLTDLVSRPVPAVPDPTLLLDKDDYDALAGNTPLMEGDYLFYYSPQPDDTISAFALQLSKLLGCKIVSSNKQYTKAERSLVSYNNAGPSEFLNLLKFAKYVCGKSLHLVLFSLLFHKQFLAVGRSKGARISSILNQVGLPSRYVEKGMNPKEVQFDDVDWIYVDKQLEALRMKGAGFLRNALE